MGRDLVHRLNYVDEVTDNRINCSLFSEMHVQVQWRPPNITAIDATSRLSLPVQLGPDPSDSILYNIVLGIRPRRRNCLKRLFVHIFIQYHIGQMI